MALVSQIITDAYQYNNLVAINAIPTADEQAKGVRYFNRIFRNILGVGLGEQLRTVELGAEPLTASNEFEIFADVPRLSAPYVLAPNSRLVLNLTTPATVFLPPSPQDGARLSVVDVAQTLNSNPLTVEGNGRKIGSSSSVVLDTAGISRDWFYRADLGYWVQLYDLTLTDVFPLPTEFEEYFITALAMRLGSSEDVELSSSLQYIFKDTLKKLRLRYRQQQQVSPEQGLLRLTRYSYGQPFTG